MAFGPGTTGRDLSQKGSLTAHWPEAPLLESLKGLEAPAQEEAEKTDDPAAAFRLGDKGGDFLRHNFAMAVRNGTLDTTQVSIQLTAGADTARMQAEKEKEERQKQSADRQFLEMLERARAYSAQLGRKIAEMEQEFARKYGDAWREQLANEILDPDIIPQQQPGESIEQYRKRLAEKLIDEMLNEDGSIKDKYKDNPQYGEFAEWAKDQFDKKSVDRAVEEMNDPNLTSEQQAEKARTFLETHSEEEIPRLIGKLEDNNSVKNAIRAHQEETLNKISLGPSSTDFM